MCRLMACIGSKPQVGTQLIEALQKASFHDPKLLELSQLKGGSNQQHKDGWGYVLYKKDHNYGSISFGQFEKPIYDSELEISMIKKSIDASSFFALMMHSRFATNGTKNCFCAHPFHLRSERGLEFFLCHNGDMVKEQLAHKLDIQGTYQTDTQLLLHYLGREVTTLDKNKITSALQSAFPYTNTAMQTLSFWFENDATPYLAITSNFNPKDLSPERERYGSIYKFHEDNFTAWMSSTLLNNLDKQKYSQSNTTILPKSHVEIIPFF